MLTRDQLLSIMPLARSRADVFLPALIEAMSAFEIDSVSRQSAFLAQIAHESGELRYTSELASGAAYDGRADLGNSEIGDGVRFKGRGLLQITGRDNYAECGAALGLDLLADPVILERAENACRSAAWWWQRHGLNTLADQGAFLRITKRINGGTNGLAARQMYFARAQQALGGQRWGET